MRIRDRRGGARAGRALLLVGGTLLGACAPRGEPPPPATAMEPSVDIQALRNSSKSYDEYLGALMLCNSPVPADWAEAARRFERLHPFRVFADDPDLIRRFRAGEEAARRELGRRGVILDAQAVFFRPYDGAKWEEARKTLLSSAPGGPDVLVWTLLQLLLGGAYRDLRMHVRYNLVQAGAPALEMSRALARRMADGLPDTPVSRIEDLVHLLVLLVEFGDPGRACLEELSRHRTANVRRAVATAIGEAVDAAGAGTLMRLLAEDPEWPVRAAAAAAAGRMGPARAVVGPALVGRLGKEREAAVLHRVLRAIGEVHYEEAVPDLMRMIEVPSRSTAEAAMYALYRITGEKRVLKEEWREWYLKTYPLWKGRPRR